MSSLCILFDLLLDRAYSIYTMADLPKTIGWIGLGAMGFPMALNLVKKMDNGTHFFVYDVVQGFVDRFVKEGGEERVHACTGAKKVADKSVCTPL